MEHILTAPRLVASTLSALALYVVLSWLFIHWNTSDALEMIVTGLAATACVALIPIAQKSTLRTALLVAAVFVFSVLLY